MLMAKSVSTAIDSLRVLKFNCLANSGYRIRVSTAIDSLRVLKLNGLASGEPSKTVSTAIDSLRVLKFEEQVLPEGSPIGLNRYRLTESAEI